MLAGSLDPDPKMVPDGNYSAHGGKIGVRKGPAQGCGDREWASSRAEETRAVYVRIDGRRNATAHRHGRQAVPTPNC